MRPWLAAGSAVNVDKNLVLPDRVRNRHKGRSEPRHHRHLDLPVEPSEPSHPYLRISGQHSRAKRHTERGERLLIHGDRRFLASHPWLGP